MDGVCLFVFFFSSRRRHTRWTGDWSSDVCSSDLHQMVDITRGGGPSVDDGTYAGQLIPDSFQDSEGYISSTPTGASYISMSFQTPEVAEPYTLSWQTGGTGTGQMNVAGSGGFTGLTTGLHSSPIT